MRQQTSILLDYLRYAAYGLASPASRQLGLLKMGMGILRRRRIYRAHWSGHLEKCIAFQNRWLEHLSLADENARRALLILGAGFLLDVDIASISRFFAHLHLVDGNRMALPAWRAASHCSGCRITAQVMEVTGLLLAWAKRLKCALNEQKRPFQWPSSLELIARIPDAALAEDHLRFQRASASLRKPGPFSAVVSLNLLSQIPIVWQDLVEAELRRRFGAAAVAEHEEEWLLAVRPAAAALAALHLRQIATLGAEEVLLLTDLQYAYYHLGEGQEAGEDGPLSWSEECSWQAEEQKLAPGPDGNTCVVFDALYGLDVDRPEVQERFFPGWVCRASDTWLWHIQPAGLGEGNRGTVNRVGAFWFRKQG